MSNLDFQEFANDDVVYFNETSGLAINVQKRRVILFQKVSGTWSWDEFHHTDIRDIERVLTTPDQYIHSGSGGTKGIGEALGAGIKNSLEKQKAHKNTGIMIRIKSIEKPSFFISIPDERERHTLFEALSQFVESASINGEFRKIPSFISRSFHMPTESEKQKSVIASDASRKMRFWITAGGVILIAIIVLVEKF